MRKAYFQNEHATISYDLEASLGIVTCHGEVAGADFREAMLISLDMIDRFELKRWIGDNRKCKAIAPADLKWSQEVLLPQLALGPLLRIALLLSHKEVSPGTVDLTIEKGDSKAQKLLIRNLDDEAAALAWLMEPA